MVIARPPLGHGLLSAPLLSPPWSGRNRVPIAPLSPFDPIQNKSRIENRRLRMIRGESSAQSSPLPSELEYHYSVTGREPPGYRRIIAVLTIGPAGHGSSDKSLVIKESRKSRV